ncbi:DUF2513 domain-containing protein [Clostridium botulinum]|nr:DUF2513 domain-containing protein [Clostridium botulinum]
MKLNYDLIRDLLLVIEDISDGVKNYSTQYIRAEHLPNHGLQAIQYHVNQLAQGGIIKVSSNDSDYIIDLTWYGHQYLSNIKNDTIWSKTKDRIKPLGNVALDITSEVAKSFILSKLGLNS